MVFFFAVSFLLYANTLHSDFIFDDKVMLVKNMYIRDLSSIPKLFTAGAFHFDTSKPFAADYYRPLQTLTYAVEYVFWQLRPAGYHLTNIALHAVNSFLVFLLICLLFHDTLLALLASSLFCVHPIQACLVSFISGRAHLLGALFMLLSLIMCVIHVTRRKKVPYAISICAYVFALLSWEGVLLLPLFILVCLGALRVDKKKILFSLMPYIILTVLYLWLRMRYMPTDRFTVLTLRSPSVIKDFLWFIQLYMTQLILPFGLRVMLFGQGLFLKFALFSVSFLVMAYFLVRAIVARDKVAVAGLLFYFIGLLPIINLTSTIKEFGHVLSEHYVYISSIGFFVFIASLIARSKNRFPAAANCMLVGMFALYSALTVLNNANYKDNVTFYTHIIDVNPNNLLIRVNLGNIYYEKGLYDKAAEQANAVLAAAPNSWSAYLLLGLVNMARGDLDKAVELYKRSYSLNPRSSDILNALAMAYRFQGREEDALKTLEKAIALNPESISAMENLADLLIIRKSYPRALEMCDKILTLNPDDVEARVKLGIILAESGRIREAEKVFMEALRLEPGSVEALQNLGSLYGNAGNFAEAVAVWEKMLAIDPGNEKAKQDIARVRLMKEGSGR